MKKVVLKMELYDDRIKQKAMTAVSGISGLESISVEMKDSKMTLTGDIDPVYVVGKLRKLCHTDILSVGPAKEEKKEEKKPDDPKPVSVLPYDVYGYCYPTRQPYYHVTSVEENPNGCVIC